MKEASIYTIGHSNKSLEVFLQKLSENEITVLVDVRTIPYSRYGHFNGNILQALLEECGITYLYRGKNLGGKAENTGYEEAVDELLEIAKHGHNVCVMCSEGDYRKCHRYSTLTPSFEQRGASVVHITYENGPTTQHLW